MVRAGLNEDFTTARKNHYELMDVMELAFAEGNPTGVKAALNILGHCENVLRLPLVPASDDLYNQMKQVVG